MGIGIMNEPSDFFFFNDFGYEYILIEEAKAASAYKQRKVYNVSLYRRNDIFGEGKLVSSLTIDDNSNRDTTNRFFAFYYPALLPYKKRLYIHSFFTFEKYMGMGYGRKLLKATVDFFNKKADILYLQVGSTIIETHRLVNFYSSLGFKEVAPNQTLCEDNPLMMLKSKK
jgi:GNAT superfamily N-acetyltransferase